MSKEEKNFNYYLLIGGFDLKWNLSDIKKTILLLKKVIIMSMLFSLGMFNNDSYCNKNITFCLNNPFNLC